MDEFKEFISGLPGANGMIRGINLGIVLGYGLLAYDVLTGNQYGFYDDLHETLNIANGDLEKAIMMLSAGTENMKIFSGILSLSFFTGEVGYQFNKKFLSKPEVQ